MRRIISRGIACSVLLGCLNMAVAQNVSTVATLKVKAPNQSYRMGDDVVIEATLTNVSKNSICFDVSPSGSFHMELYDLQDVSGEDLYRTLMQRKDKQAAVITMDVCHQLAPGEAWKEKVVLNSMPSPAAHPGSYKVVVSRVEQVNHMKIVANPITIEILP